MMGRTDTANLRIAMRYAVLNQPRQDAWAVVKDFCAVGSTTAHRMCERFGIDPNGRGRKALSYD